MSGKRRIPSWPRIKGNDIIDISECHVAHRRRRTLKILFVLTEDREGKRHHTQKSGDSFDAHDKKNETGTHFSADPTKTGSTATPRLLRSRVSSLLLLLIWLKTTPLGLLDKGQREWKRIKKSFQSYFFFWVDFVLLPASWSVIQYRFISPFVFNISGLRGRGKWGPPNTAEIGRKKKEPQLKPARDFRWFRAK